MRLLTKKLTRTGHYYIVMVIKLRLNSKPKHAMPCM